MSELNVPQKSVQTKTCSFFLQGRCRFGSSCKFIHGVADAQGQISPNAKGKQEGRGAHTTNSLDRQPSGATSSHSASSPRPFAMPDSTQRQSKQPLPVQPTDTPIHSLKKGNLPCHLWRAGTCAKGDKCQFIHDPQVQEDVMKARAAAEEHEAARQAERKIQQEARLAEVRKEEAAMVVQRIILGSIVTFGAGLEIRHSITGFESCCIRIWNLPFDATVNEVHALFTQQGIQPVSFCVSSLWRTPDGKQEATVLSDAMFGEIISVGLDGIEFRNEKLMFEVIENGGSGDMGRSPTTKSNTLRISWWAPFVSYIAQYPDITQAEAKVRELNGKMCGGRKVKLEINRPPPGVVLNHFNPNSVKITGLSPSVTQAEVQSFSGSFSLQRLKVKEYDVDRAHISLRLHMERIADGPVIFENPPTDAVGRNITVQAHFDSWDQAEKVHDSLANQHFPFIANGTFKLHLPDPFQYKITIPAEQYHAQRKQWSSLVEVAHRDKECSLMVKNSGRSATIRVVGCDKKLVGSLKVRVENLAAGVKLEGWHHWLARAGNSFLKSVIRETGAYVRNDWRLRALKVYGEPSAVKNACAMIDSEIERLASLEQTVLLKRQSIRFFVRSGVATLKELLGKDNVTLDLSQFPCKIMIRGGEDARHALAKLIQESLSDVTITQSEEGGSLCPVCFSEVSSPVHLACGHRYCTACICHFLTTACDNKMLPLLCLGDESKCSVPIPIPMIQKFLPQTQFNRLVKVAFEVHLEQHPQEFKYCTTPDCKQIYRCGGSKPQVVHCPSCFSAVCSGCHGEAHEGMSCAERKLLDDPAEQEHLNEQWAKSQGIKKCPDCGVWIEKTEGCNHVSCRCGAHICWVCMGTFTAGTIYEHMRMAHGGIHGEPLDNEVNEQDRLPHLPLALEEGVERERERVANARREEQRIMGEWMRIWELEEERRRMEEWRTRRELEAAAVEEERRIMEGRRRQELEAAAVRRVDERRRTEEWRRRQEPEAAVAVRRTEEEQRKMVHQAAAARRAEEHRNIVQRAVVAAQRAEEQRNRGSRCIIM